MALIECPDCGQKVSDKAPTCPSCGRPINLGEESKSTGKKRGAANAKAKGNSEVVCPKCGLADMTQKVTSILAQYTVTSKQDGETVGATYTFGKGDVAVLGAVHSMEGKQKNVLCEKLAPPPGPPPKDPPYWETPIHITYEKRLNYYKMLKFTSPILASSVAFISYTNASDKKNGILIAILAIIAGIIVMFYGSAKAQETYDNRDKLKKEDIEAKKAIEEAKRKYEEELKKYNKKYYKRYRKYIEARRKWKRLYYCFRDDGVFDPQEGKFVPIDKMKSYLLPKNEKAKARSKSKARSRSKKSNGNGADEEKEEKVS